MKFKVFCALAIVLVTGGAEASTCAKIEWSDTEVVSQAFENAQVVFSGKPRIGYAGWVDVDAVWKGEVPPAVNVNRMTSGGALFFGIGPKNNGSYESFGGGMGCFYLPDYEVTRSILETTYGTGVAPRENYFAVSWFVSLSAVLLVAVSMLLWQVVKSNGKRGIYGDA